MKDTLKNYSDLLTVCEVAEILRVSSNVVYKLIQDKKILAYKFGRQYKIPKIDITYKYLSIKEQ